ncbi:MAG: metallophosphoesterase, partial [Rhodothermales bacterium]|nr:metallophosphoesterase [Rhodothermales bacterium]
MVDTTHQWFLHRPASWLLLTLLAVAACAPARLFVADAEENWRALSPPPDDEEIHRVLLIGDVGAVPLDGSSPVLRGMRHQLAETADRSTVVFLGDNLYCCGLPDSASPDRAAAETRLRDFLSSASQSGARVIVIPGNHDWNDSNPGGLEAVRRQEQFVEAFLDAGDSFLPSDGFPGPARVKLTDDIILLAVDTEWYLTDHPKSFGDDGRNDISERDDLLLELAEEVRKADDEHVIVVGHHPLMSNGIHAGAAPVREHLFPLTALWSNAYIPLPVVGTLSILYRQYLGVNE